MDQEKDDVLAGEAPVASPFAEDIENVLRRRVVSMAAGERLPTVRQLMTTHGVGQLKVQRALARLKQEGLIDAHVGRGTFVGVRTPSLAASRRVLVLAHEEQTDRLDEIDKALHRAFIRRDWRSAVLTYSDFDHAMQLIEGGSRIDAAVVQPRGAILPLDFLANLHRSSDAVVIEGYPVTGVNVDCVGIDWPAAVYSALRHLVDQGHRRIGYVTMAHPSRFFQAALEQFRQLHAWAGLPRDPDPEILLTPAPEEELFARLANLLFGRGGRNGASAYSALVIYPGPFHGRLLLEALENARLGVPTDLSVVMIGFTDLQHEHVGRLSTVGLSSEQLTETVAVAIENRWRNPGAPYGATYLRPEFFDRGSTRRPR